MRGLFFLAGAVRRAVEIAGHRVPADPAVGEMIERRHPPRERIRRLIGQVRGYAEAEVFGDGGHRRDKQQRIVGRRLRRVSQRPVRTAAEHVIHAEYIGEKQTVKSSALQRFCQMGPVRQPVVVRRAVAGMGPQPRRLVRDTVHRKGVEPNFFFHGRKPQALGSDRSGIARSERRASAELVAFRPALARQMCGATSGQRCISIRCLEQKEFTVAKGRHDQS